MYVFCGLVRSLHNFLIITLFFSISSLSKDITVLIDLFASDSCEKEEYRKIFEIKRLVIAWACAVVDFFDIEA